MSPRSGRHNGREPLAVASGLMTQPSGDNQILFVWESQVAPATRLLPQAVLYLSPAPGMTPVTSVRPEGPACNSHDRKVVVRRFEMNGEARRAGTTFFCAGPSGLGYWVVDLHPDLTVGAISYRPFGPSLRPGAYLRRGWFWWAAFAR